MLRYTSTEAGHLAHPSYPTWSKRFSISPAHTIINRRSRSIYIVAVLGTPQESKRTDLPSSRESHTYRRQSDAHREANLAQGASHPSQLFPDRHVQRPDLLFYAYFPLGVVIAGVRMLMWLSLLSLDQAWLTNNDLSIRALQAILGVRVTWDNLERLPKDRHVIVSNHVTTGDMMALYRLPVRTVHLISSQLPARIAQSKHHRIEFRHASVNSYDRLKDEPSTAPIHLFPEGGMTNGAGMMKFNKGFMRFSEGLQVLPVALKANMPWGISTHTLNSSFLSNLFWFCFSPYVSLQMKVLPPISQMSGETKSKFVERIQQCIADDLQIPIFDFTLQAKKQLMLAAKKGK